MARPPRIPPSAISMQTWNLHNSCDRPGSVRRSSWGSRLLRWFYRRDNDNRFVRPPTPFTVRRSCSRRRSPGPRVVRRPDQWSSSSSNPSTITLALTIPSWTPVGIPRTKRRPRSPYFFSDLNTLIDHGDVPAGRQQSRPCLEHVLGGPDHGRGSDEHDDRVGLALVHHLWRLGHPNGHGVHPGRNVSVNNGTVTFYDIG